MKESCFFLPQFFLLITPAIRPASDRRARYECSTSECDLVQMPADVDLVARHAGGNELIHVGARSDPGTNRSPLPGGASARRRPLSDRRSRKASTTSGPTSPQQLPETRTDRRDQIARVRIRTAPGGRATAFGAAPSAGPRQPAWAAATTPSRRVRESGRARNRRRGRRWPLSGSLLTITSASGAARLRRRCPRARRRLQRRVPA